MMQMSWLSTDFLDCLTNLEILLCALSFPSALYELGGMAKKSCPLEVLPSYPCLSSLWLHGNDSAVPSVCDLCPLSASACIRGCAWHAWMCAVPSPLLSLRNTVRHSDWVAISVCNLLVLGAQVMTYWVLALLLENSWPVVSNILR